MTPAPGNHGRSRLGRLVVLVAGQFHVTVAGDGSVAALALDAQRAFPVTERAVQFLGIDARRQPQVELLLGCPPSARHRRTYCGRGTPPVPERRRVDIAER